MPARRSRPHPSCSTGKSGAPTSSWARPPSPEGHPGSGPDSAEGTDGVRGFRFRDEPANRKFVEAYQKEYNGAEPDRQAPWTYDAVYLLANAIRKVGEDRAKIREALLATKGFEGVLGTYTFSADGDGLRGGPIAVIKNGKPQLVKMISLN